MAMFSDLNKVRDWFVLNDVPFFVVKKGNDQLFSNYSIDDVNASADNLINRLELIEDSSEYKIYQFAKIPKGTASKLILDGAYCLSFARPKKTYTPDEQSQYWKSRAIGGSDPAMLQLINDLRDDNRAMREQLNSVLKYQQELDESDDDDDVADQSQPQDFFGSMMGNPAVQNILTNFLVNLGASLAPNMITKKPTAMAGTDTNQSSSMDEQTELIHLVNQLLAKGVTIEHLRKLCAMPDDKINFLLGML